MAECKADAEGWGARSHGPGSERDPGGWVRGPVGGVTRMVAARVDTEMLIVQNKISISSD